MRNGLEDRTSLGASWTNRHIWDSEYSFLARFSAYRFIFLDWDEVRHTTSISVGRSFFDNDVSLNLGYRFIDLDVSDVDSDASDFALNGEGKYWHHVLFSRQSYQRLNHPMFPTEGIKISLDQELAGAPLGGSSKYYSVNFNADVFVPIHTGDLGGQTVLHVGQRNRWVDGIGSDQVPFYERIFGGGPAPRFRGFERNDLSPSQINQRNIFALTGGTADWVTSFEFINLCKAPIMESSWLASLISVKCGAMATRSQYAICVVLPVSVFASQWLSPLLSILPGCSMRRAMKIKPYSTSRWVAFHSSRPPLPKDIIMLRICVCLVLLLSAATAADNSAVLYIEKVFNEAKLVESAYDDFKAEAGEVRGQVQAYTDQIEQLKTVISTYHPTDPKFFEKKQELETIGLHRKMFLEHHKEQLDKKELQILAGVYDDIRKKLHVYAADRGLDLVMLAANPDVGGVGSMNELRLQLATHAVLYYRQDLDITADFIAYLDKQLAAENPAPSPIATGIRQRLQ